jgi:hypothetical protein
MIRVLINTAQRNPRLLPVSFSKGKMHGSFQLISFLSLSLYIYIYIYLSLSPAEYNPWALYEKTRTERKRKEARRKRQEAWGERRKQTKANPSQRERARKNEHLNASQILIKACRVSSC